MSATNTILPIITTVVAQARKRIVAHFLAQHAISPEDAVPFVPEPGVEEGQFRQMIAKGVVREAAPGGFWLDRAAHEAEIAARRRFLVPVVIVLCVAAAAAILLAYQG